MKGPSEKNVNGWLFIARGNLSYIHDLQILCVYFVGLFFRILYLSGLKRRLVCFFLFPHPSCFLRIVIIFITIISVRTNEANK